jgi:LysM repeat protein
VAIGSLLLAIVALAAVLLLSVNSGASHQTAATPSPVVPGRPTGAPVGATGSAATPAPTPRPTDAPLKTSITAIEPNYTVEPGDTLGQIARRFGTSVEALRALNRLEDAAVLRIGQRLIVPQD